MTFLIKIFITVIIVVNVIYCIVWVCVCACAYTNVPQSIVKVREQLCEVVYLILPLYRRAWN